MSEGREQPSPAPLPALVEREGSPATAVERNAVVAAKLVVALDRLARAQRQHRQTAASRLGLTPLQAELLSLLAAGPPPAHVVGELARELGVRQPTLTDSASALERKGLIVRRRLANDRRRTGLALTAAGHELASELSRSQAELIEALAGLAAEECTSTYVAVLGVIKRLVDSGIIEVARTCLTCRYFAPATETAGRHCTLLDMPLPDEALRVDCPEHEPAAAHALKTVPAPSPQQVG